jgi:tetratricopeptide (TPR) repeat protein
VSYLNSIWKPDIHSFGRFANLMKLLIISIAMTVLNAGPVLGQTSPQEFNRQGIALGREGKFEEAVSLFTKAIALDAKYDEAYYNRGKAKLNWKQFRAAIKDFDTAIKLRPKYADAYNNRGIAKKKISDLAGAIGDYTFALRYDSKQYPIYYNRGVARFENRDQPGACADFTIAAQHDVPQSADALRKAGCRQ